MTDYKNLKLIASSSPHIRSNEDTRSIMLDVIIALLPALAWSVYAFGWKALLLTAVSVVSCVVLGVGVPQAHEEVQHDRRPVRSRHRYPAELRVPR